MTWAASPRPLYREIDDGEIARLAEASEHPGVRAYLAEIAADGRDNYDGRFLAHRGDLDIDGSFDTGTLDLTLWFIDGDLTVAGLLETRCDDGPMMAIIAGDLRCGDLLTAGYLEVCGDLVVTGALVGDYNDGGALVRGDLEAELFLPFDHAFAVHGDNRAVEAIDGLYAPARPSRLAPRYWVAAAGGYRVIADSINADLRSGRSLVV